jgi:hypothetical protein
VVVTELRQACQRVAETARHVHVRDEQIRLYAASLPEPPPSQAAVLTDPAERERAAWYWLTMDAINFGSGWFPTLRKRPGATGYSTVSSGLARRFAERGPWSAAELMVLSPLEIAQELDQDPDHELMGLFAASLNNFGTHLQEASDGRPLDLIDSAGASAARLIDTLAGWACFHDVCTYDGVAVPFNKRSQIAAADLARAGVATFDDLSELTMFADNLVPHVLRLDGILDFSPALVARIEAEQLIEHGSPEEVEIRACAVHAVELIVCAVRDAARRDASGAEDSRASAGQIDELLWQRGQGRHYKSTPRHRSRCTAY